MSIKIKKFIVALALFLLAPVSPAYAIDNYKYGSGNKSIISSTNGTYLIGNGGNTIDAAYDKAHLGGILDAKGLFEGSDKYLIYFSPEHGQIDVCKAYKPDCYAFWDFIYVGVASPEKGSSINWMKFADGTETMTPKTMNIAPFDGTATPPTEKPKVEIENLFKDFTGQVYLDSKLPENLIKKSKKLIDFSLTGSTLTGSVDRTQLPASTDANGTYIIKGVNRTLTNGEYDAMSYTVSIKKRMDNVLLEQYAIPAVCLASLSNPASAVAGLAICGPNAAEILKNADEEIWLMGETNITIAADGTISDQDIIVKEVRISAIDKALSSAIRTVAGFVQETTKFVMNAINSLLTETANYVVGDVGDTSDTRGVLGPWTAMRNIGLSLLVMALIIIAFANVLQIDIEQYGLGRMIPKIIISIFMAMASWIIVVFFFDFTQALQQQAIGLVGGSNGLSSLGNMSIEVPSAGDILGKLGGLLLLIAIFFGVLVCGVVLLFTLIVRIVMLSLLLAVAPLAFILNVVPFTSNLYKMWWTEFWKWMFMGPVALLIIALGSVIAASASGGQTTTGLAGIDASTITSSDSGVRMLIGLIIFAGSLYVAATLPLKWGGNIMKSFAKGSKKLAGWAGKTSGASGAVSLIGNKMKTAAGNSQALRANKLASFVSGGKVGTSTDILRGQQRDAAVTEAGKQIGVGASNDATLAARYDKANDYEKIAIEREMAGRGSFEKLFASKYINPETGGFYDKGDAHYEGQDKDAIERQAKISAGAHLAKLGGSDTVLEKSVKDNQGEIAVAAAQSGTAYGESLKNGFLAGQKGKAGHLKRTQALEFLGQQEAADFITENDVKQIMGKDGDAKKQGHLETFINRGAASRGVTDAYHAAKVVASSNQAGSAGVSQGYSSGAPSASATQAAEDLRNKYK